MIRNAKAFGISKITTLEYPARPSTDTIEMMKKLLTAMTSIENTTTPNIRYALPNL